jgi:hypothetical protein
MTARATSRTRWTPGRSRLPRTLPPVGTQRPHTLVIGVTASGSISAGVTSSTAGPAIAAPKEPQGPSKARQGPAPAMMSRYDSGTPSARAAARSVWAPPCFLTAFNLAISVWLRPESRDSTSWLRPFAALAGGGLDEPVSIWFVLLAAATEVLLIVSVNDRLASGPAPLWAVSVIGYLPPLPAAGVPWSVAVPSWLSLKVTPPGSSPASARLGTGDPLVLTVNDPACPTVKVGSLS